MMSTQSGLWDTRFCMPRWGAQPLCGALIHNIAIATASLWPLYGHSKSLKYSVHWCVHQST